ncbi:MAG TPA: hypothetical protein VMY41_16305 [Thermohalobaculum sp.]|nr:hypothetical protein [Thermohalobaculum sp.]
MATKHPRTTHSDLAAILEAHTAALTKVPAGYCVSDAGTMRCLADAARILREQDLRIGELTVALREHGGAAARQYFTKKVA